MAKDNTTAKRAPNGGPFPTHLEPLAVPPAAPKHKVVFSPNLRALEIAKRRLEEMFLIAEKTRAWGTIGVSVDFNEGCADGYVHTLERLKDKVPSLTKALAE